NPFLRRLARSNPRDVVERERSRQPVHQIVLDERGRIRGNHQHAPRKRPGAFRPRNEVLALRYPELLELGAYGLLFPRIPGELGSERRLSPYAVQPEPRVIPQVGFREHELYAL